MATNQQNINIGTADNANDGDVLRAAFRKVRKMFAEIYGDTDAENLTDTEVVPATSFDTHITEKIQDTVSGMFSSGDQTNITVTYDDNDGSIDLNVAADITDVNAGDGLTGTNEDGGAATLAVGAGDGITVNADDVALASSVAGAGLSYASGVLSVDAIGTDGIANDAVTAAKIALFDDTLAATDTHVLVADGTDFNNVALSGDATISNTGALSIANDVIDYAKLDDEFTTSTAIAASAVDFSSAAVFTKTLTGTTTLTFSNVFTGMVKTLVISGDQTLAMTGVTTLNGEYSGTASKNVIQIVSTNGSSEMFATISNVA